MNIIRWRQWISALGLLVIGAVVGVSTDRLLHRGGSFHARLLEAVHRDPVGLMERELHLTPDQRTRVAAILAARQGHIDAVWHETRSHLRATVDSVVSEIAAVLDSSQAARFTALADEIHNSPGFVPGGGH